MANQLYTTWGKELDPARVLQEYPRPELVRSSYLNLNGIWEYAITDNVLRPEEFDGSIVVPFSPEAALSGVGIQVKPDEYLHYHRTLELTAEFLKGRCLLHFGAVDQRCEVYVNEILVGEHTGGYLPFSLDVTDAVHAGENDLYLCVQDFSDTSYHARGKQKLERGGMWYTAQSGIWQTVWMECVPEHYIRELKIVPDYDAGAVKIKIIAADHASPGTVEGSEEPETPQEVTCVISISYEGKIVASRGTVPGKMTSIPLGEEIHSWTPEEPKLYDVSVRMGRDYVTSYFGMRKLHVARDGEGILRFFLNNQPYFHNGLLDQGYWPDGLYTAPSDEALQYDIRRMKELGFNMLRKHIKIEPSRWYYHCDRIGMLVWQDMVNGGEVYDMTYICTMPNAFMWTDRIIKDGPRKYKRFARANAEGRAEYYRELKAMIRHLYNHPSIVAWVPFNEGWGQFDAFKATELVRSIDPTRLIDEASGWFDQHGGDMYSIHNYWRTLKVKPQKDRVVALTECGGYSYRMEGRSYCDEVYGYRKYYSKKELTDGVCGLWEKELIPALKNGLGASVYTQVSDVEEEVNGLITWDREETKVLEERMQEANRKLMEAFTKLTASEENRRKD